MKQLMILFAMLPFQLTAESCHSEFVVTGLKSFAHYHYTDKIDKLYQHPKQKSHWIPIATRHPTTGDLYYSVSRMPKSTLMDFLRPSKSGVRKVVNGKEQLLNNTGGIQDFLFYGDQMITPSPVWHKSDNLSPEILKHVPDAWPQKEKEIKADPQIQQALKDYPSFEKQVEILSAYSMKRKRPFTMIRRRGLESTEDVYQYPFGPVVAQFLYGDILYITNISNSIYKINLRINRITRLDDDLINWYHPSIFVAPSGKVFVITSEMNPNVKPNSTLKPNTFYELRGKKLIKRAFIDVPHLHSRVQSIDNKIYVLLKDRTLFEYNMSNRKTNKVNVPYRKHDGHQLPKGGYKFNLLDDNHFLFTERGENYTFENRPSYAFITDKNFKLLDRKKLEGINGIWNISTCKNPVGNFHI